MKAVALAVVFLACVCARAERSVGFGARAFAASVGSGFGRSAVFSPLAHELDAVVYSESLDTLAKAEFVSALGAVVGYGEVYKPVIAAYGALKGCSLVSARAFVVPTAGVFGPSFRQNLQQEWGVECCSVGKGTRGADAWFRAATFGEMEDFALPVGKDRWRGVSLVTSVSVALDCPGLSAGGEISFNAPGGVRRLPALGGTVEARLWERKDFALFGWRLSPELAFYALTPAAGADAAAVTAAFAGEAGELMASLWNLTDPKVFAGAVELALPEFDERSTLECLPAFVEARLPYDRFAGCAPGTEVGTLLQRVRLRLRPAAAPAAKAPAARSLALDRPFLYFVHHAPTDTMPVAGIFTGTSE